MPTYEYECKRCGHRFEKFQQMSDRPVKRCPECSGPVRRLLGAGAAVLVRGGTSSGPTRCGRQTPCCGAEVPCQTCPSED